MGKAKKDIQPVVLIVIDGWGHSDEIFGNAIREANTPNMDRLAKECPSTTVAASGEAVGLPPGQQGNSEVGHLTIGAGRVIRQDLGLQKHAIESGVFFENEILIGAIERAIEHDSALHIMGLVSDGGVHSHQDSAVATAKLAKKLGLSRVYIHAFLDGRDTPPQSAAKHIKELQNDLREAGVGKIASVAGRYYAMDRDNRWERTQKAYRMLTGESHPVHSSAIDYIHARYEDDETDEFMLPISIADSVDERHYLDDNDTVVFFNFRPDRARQLSRALVDADFEDFDRGRVVRNLHVVTFSEYDESLGVPVAFPKDNINNCLAEVISEAGLMQFHVAETEKYAHVTYFLNGGREEPFEREDRLMVPSLKVSTYDEQPEMSAHAVAAAAIKRIQETGDELIVINFANPDMVGHTGLYEPTIRAVEVTDECIGKIVQTARKHGYATIITADHGNAEIEIDSKDDSPVTSHSTNPVPVIVCGSELDSLRKNGSLSDVAPTLLGVMGLPVPEEMTGRSL